MQIPALSNPDKPFNCIFIRAPAVHSLGDPRNNQEDQANGKGHPPVETLATLPEECTPPLPPSDSALGSPNPADLGKVMIRHGRKLVTSFHPELSGDTRIHQYWVEKCVLGR